MLHRSASVVALWRALAETGGASACRGSGDSDGSGKMARMWPLMLHESAPVVVAGRVCREGVGSASGEVVRAGCGMVAHLLLEEPLRDVVVAVVL